MMQNKYQTEVLNENPLILNIYKMIYNENRNIILIIVGDPRTGKSWDSLSLGECVSPRFSATNVFFTASDIIRALKEPELLPNGTKNPFFLEKGDVVVFDEGGVEANARLWYKKAQIFLMEIFQTFGERNLLLIITTPDIKFVDAQGRKLAKWIWKTEKVDYSEKLGILRPFEVIRQPHIENYKPYLKKFTYNGMKVKELALPIPSKTLREQYEKNSKIFKRNLYKKAENNADKVKEIIYGEEVEVLKKKIITNVLKEILENPKKYSINNIIDKHLIEGYHSNISSETAKIVQKMAMNELNKREEITGEKYYIKASDKKEKRLNK